jgi:o-succinylbenzoate synthase
MRIVEVTSVRLPMTLVDPLRTSHGTHDLRIASLVRVVTDDGVTGWGEDVAPSGVRYVGDTAHESLVALRELAPRLCRGEILAAEMLSDSWWGSDGQRFAKHAFESAVWDAEARSRGESLASLLGGVRHVVHPGVVIGVHDSIDDTVAAAMARISEGYTRIKLKIEPGRDIDVVREVRSAIGIDTALQVDANGAYTRDHFDLLAQLDEFDLQFVEQPFAADDFGAHAELAGRMSTPVCLDESIITCADLTRGIDSGACSVVNIKPSRVGGIGDAVAMHDIARAAGIDAWVGGMLETGIGRASCLALASLPGFTLSPDLSASNRYFARDVTDPFVLHEGSLGVPTGSGIGVEPLPWVFEHPEVVIETLFHA